MFYVINNGKHPVFVRDTREQAEDVLAMLQAPPLLPYRDKFTIAEVEVAPEFAPIGGYVDGKPCEFKLNERGYAMPEGAT